VLRKAKPLVLFTSDIQILFHKPFTLDIIIPYILESNPQSVFGDFLNGKKLVPGSNPHLSFNRPVPTG
jgi:hypothetical protein